MRKSVALILFLLFAQTACAQVSISEIMYDPEGPDTNHEWIEIVNQGSDSVDLTQSKFVEGNSTSVSNHNLVSVHGDTSLKSGAYAIIADNGQTFLDDHPGFSGIVLDSSFSLNNTTGETIAFKMPDGTISDTVTYTSDMGATEDGNSLQKINSTWISALPTPGIANAHSETNVFSSGSSQTNTTSFSGASGDTPTDTSTSSGLSAHITIRSTGIVSGAPIIFSGEVVDTNKRKITNALYQWTFGDGDTGGGDIVAHIFRYPGKYIVTLEATLGSSSASTRIKVTVVPALLRAALHDASSSAVDIFNDGANDADLSSWIIEAGYRRFAFPTHTMLSGHSFITLAPETTGFHLPVGFINIRYPNGDFYEQIKKEVTPTEPVAQVALKEKQSPKTIVSVPTPQKIQATQSYTQTASVADAFSETPTSPVAPISESRSSNTGMLPWYIGAAFFAAFALLTLRYTRGGEEDEFSANDFEITEVIDPEEPH